MDVHDRHMPSLESIIMINTHFTKLGTLKNPIWQVVGVQHNMLNIFVT